MDGSGSATPGEWPANWKPTRLGGVAQKQPPVVSFTVGGANNALFVGSQVSSVYAIDGEWDGFVVERVWSSDLPGHYRKPQHRRFSRVGTNGGEVVA